MNSNPSALHFDQNGEAYWQGRRVIAEDLRPILDAFDSIVSRQLLAWVERRILGIRVGMLPESGVLAQMAGVAPLRGLLNELENGLKPESCFDDRLAQLPSRPQAPEKPRFRHYPNGTLAAELEERQYTKEQARYEKAHHRWQIEDKAWLENQPDFPRRIAKFKEFKIWEKDRKSILEARDKVVTWENFLKVSSTNSGWEFFPPGPGLEYTFDWVKIRLNQRFPEARFDFERIASLISFQPEVLHFGSGDFNDGYIAFVFPNGRVALESPVVGNALYLFHSDWIDLSRKPKLELRDMMKHGDRRVARYFHADGGNLKAWLDLRLRGLA